LEKTLTLNSFKAVIFDMDGVIIDSEPLWEIAIRKGFEHVGFTLTKAQAAQTVGLRIDEVIAYWHTRFQWEKYSNKNVERFIIDELKVLIAERGVALKGVAETLQFLKNQHLKIGLGTSSYEELVDFNLEHLQLASYFDFTHSAEKEEYGKPHPAVYLSVAKKLGVSPLECLVIEDSFPGMIAAKAARMKVVAIPEKSHQFDKRLIIADYQFENMGTFLEAINK